MKRHFTLFCLTFALFASAHAQTLRIRSNSVENLHIVCIGMDKAGHTISKTLYDVSYDYWKTISLYDVKYGYDKYNNKAMKHSGYDPSLRWKMLVIYNNSTSKCDTLNLTERQKEVHLGLANVRAKVNLSYERRYEITDVVLNDEE